MKDKTVFTLEEISKSWFKFTSPKYLVDKDAEIREVENTIYCDNPKNIKLLEIDYSRWLSYLISREWEKEENNDF